MPNVLFHLSGVGLGAWIFNHVCIVHLHIDLMYFNTIQMGFNHLFVCFQVACGQDHSLFLTETGKVFACGWGADGQTGQYVLEKVKSSSVGHSQPP